MIKHQVRLSKDKLEFLGAWEKEKYDHLQEMLQHLMHEERIHNHAHCCT